MIEEYEKKRRGEIAGRRSLMDYGMGIIFFALGVAFLLNEILDINILGREPSKIDYLIGSLFVLYGIWRLYRGYKKNYFR